MTSTSFIRLTKALLSCLAICLPLQSKAVGWTDGGKITAIAVHYEGSISVNFNQNLPIPNGCQYKHAVVILASEPNGTARSPEKMARLLALLLSAQARDVTVAVYIERDDCVWSAALGAGGIEVRN